jgi:hypothetical protein
VQTSTTDTRHATIAATVTAGSTLLPTLHIFKGKLDEQIAEMICTLTQKSAFTPAKIKHVSSHGKQMDQLGVDPLEEFKGSGSCVTACS